MPKSLSFSTFCPPVEYFQRLGCVLGPASAALCSALEGMLMSTAGVSYRHLGWKRELSTNGQACALVGILRRRNFSLNSQREASQGFHQEQLTLGSHTGDLKQGNT